MNKRFYVSASLLSAALLWSALPAAAQSNSPTTRQSSEQVSEPPAAPSDNVAAESSDGQVAAGEGASSKAEALQRAAPKPPSPLWTDARPQRRRSDAPLHQERFATIASEQSPAIVNIEIELPPSRRHPNHHAVGQGSGFFIHRDGYIVTNAHVVANAQAIHVTTADRHVYTAEVVGLDLETDVALIRVVQDSDRPKNPRFPILQLGDSSTVRPGEWVVAIGNPFGLHHTVTAGIVSAVGRRDMVSALQLRYADFIQIDAAINFGNSGGPLLNMQGHVIGMNTAIQAGNDLGFAIPSQMIREVLPQLTGGELRRAWSGLTFEDLSVEDARSLPNGRRGAKVLGVATQSPASGAGFKRGDVVLSFDGRSVEDSAQLNWWIASSEPESSKRFVVLRDGAQREVRATLQLAPLAVKPAAVGENKTESPPPVGPPAGPRTLGVSVGALDDEARERLAVPMPGVIVLWIESGSPAAQAGLQVGDVITHLGDVGIGTPEEFLARGKQAEQERRVGIRAVRGRAQIFLFLQRSR